MGDLKHLQGVIVGTFVLFYVAMITWEMRRSRRLGRKIYSGREVAASLATGAIHLGITLAIPLAAQLFFLDLAYAHSLFKIPPGPLHFLGAFLLTDFFYYLQHRLNHESDFFWSFHQAHHTSLEYNLFTGIRVSWITPFFAALFLAPLAWIGIRPDYIILSLTIVFYGQWWCHTTLIGKLGVAEKILNTPASHRVHHSPDGEICRHNYAGFLIVWDRWLGTYRAESAPIQEFGTSYGFVGHNPFVINLGGIVRYVRNRGRA